MYGYIFVRNLLEKYINKGIKRFVVYPFGENGIIVKNVLKEYFGLEPCFIVDNKCSRYNHEVVNIETFKKSYCKDMYIILTVEKPDLNYEMYNKLLEFVPLSNIINLGKKDTFNCCSSVYCLDGLERLFIDDFLPNIETMTYKRQKSEKIKVRIVHSTPYSWNTISTICQAFKDDKLFDVLLLIGQFVQEKMIKQAVEYGYCYVLQDEYRGGVDKPDILIFSAPFDRVANELLVCRNYAKLVIVASWMLIRYSFDNSIEKVWHHYQKDFGIYRPDYYLVDSLLYRELNYLSDKIIEMGNAKYDDIYRAMQKKQYIGKWKKLQGKTNILWCTTHGLSNEGLFSGCTFDVYAKTVFEYANCNKDVGIIFRPHPHLIKELLMSGFWSEDDLLMFKEYFENSCNLFFDDTDNYDMALSMADGVFVDATCGVICTALPTLKPICVAYRSKNDIDCNKNLTENFYSAFENKDAIAFFEMIKRRKDPMLELRKKASRKYIKHFDGKNGWRIKEFIKEKFIEKEGFNENIYK